MGIFDFFKKDKQVKEKQRLSQNQLNRWLSDKEKELNNKEEEFLNPVKQRMSRLISELKEEIIVLENVDINAKKVNAKVKLIVKENLKNYLGYLQRVIQRLESIDSGKEIVKKIDDIFTEFDKRSKISYEKITFIVGKEMQATKDSIKKFFKDLEMLIKQYKESFKEFQTIGLIETSTEKLNNIKENKSKILEILNEDIDKIKRLKESLENKENEAKEIKKSERYLKEEKKKQELEVKNSELQRITRELSKIIDFKPLTNFYHKFETDMNLVKQFRENFNVALKRNGIEKLGNFLKEAKLDNKEILELIEKINNVTQEIKEIKIEDTGILFLEKGIDKIKSEIKTIDSERASKEKKLKYLNQELEDILEEIKETFEKIDIEFE